MTDKFTELLTKFGISSRDIDGGLKSTSQASWQLDTVGSPLPGELPPYRGLNTISVRRNLTRTSLGSLMKTQSYVKLPTAR